MDELIKIIIADCSPVFAIGLEAILKTIGFEVVGKALNGEDVLSILESNIVDIVMLSFCLPKLDGLEVAEIIKKTYPSTKIILLSGCENDAIIKTAKRLGVEGYVNKHEPIATIKDVVSSVANGFYRYIEFIDRNVTFVPRRILNLTRREIEILKYSAEGKSSKEIADILQISSRTVEHHRLNLRKKLEINSSVDYLRLAIKFNLINTTE